MASTQIRHDFNLGSRKYIRFLIGAIVKVVGKDEYYFMNGINNFASRTSQVGKMLPFLLIFRKFMKNGAFFVFTTTSKSL
jgi:hypothetical protein